MGVLMRRDDNQAELERFCREQHVQLVRWLTLHLGDQGVAEELAQDAIARVCQHWGRVGNMANPRAWLNRVAVNLATSWFRRRAAERRAQSRHGPTDPAAVPVDAADVVAIREAIVQPERQRTALVLRHFEDLPVAEVAEVMGCAAGTVKALRGRSVTDGVRSVLRARRSGMHPERGREAECGRPLRSGRCPTG